MFRLGMSCVLLFVLLASILAPVSPAAAQETGTLTLNLGTRKVIGTAASASVKTALPEGAITSWKGFAYTPALLPTFLLDGVAPDGGDGLTYLTWSGVVSGAHTITVPTMLSTYEFTSNAGDTNTLWGVLYDAYIPSQSQVGEVTAPATVDTALARSVAVAPVPTADAIVTALPAAGFGPALVRDGRLLIVMITLFLIAGGILRNDLRSRDRSVK